MICIKWHIWLVTSIASPHSNHTFILDQTCVCNVCCARLNSQIREIITPWIVDSAGLGVGWWVGWVSWRRVRGVEFPLLGRSGSRGRPFLRNGSSWLRRTWRRTLKPPSKVTPAAAEGHPRYQGWFCSRIQGQGRHNEQTLHNMDDLVAESGSWEYESDDVAEREENLDIARH